ncbi:UDP-N-acetylmuramoyl-L-alanyl-D-glutamate--2,6-diaminopimelate ligase [soil metagenome]
MTIRLVDLIHESGLRAFDVCGDIETPVFGISIHAQKTARGEAFVAINGTKVDSHILISEAVAAGATVLVVEKDLPAYPGVTTLRVPSTRFALGPLVHAMNGNPARTMEVCGITGTNGKTTSSHLLASVLKEAGRKTGLIGTLGAYFGGKFVPLNTTTPGPQELAEIMAAMRGDGIDSVVMECSSHAIDQGRINGITYKVGAFLGVTQDHLDYHGTFQSYVDCKKKFFTDYVAPTPGGLACFNFDDPICEDYAKTYMGNHIGYSRSRESNCGITAEGVQLTSRGTEFILNINGGSAPVKSRFIGAFNVTNMLTAAACAHGFGLDVQTIAHGLENAPAVAGRFEFIDEGQPFSVVVDYAHTPDALERVLRTARRLCSNRLITVFGCGGDRDRLKRPIMGKAVGDATDFAIITSDNPRTEDPTDIAYGIVEGIRQSTLKMNRHHVVLDRRQAIDQAINMACPGDVVVIAGKGHEDYQDIGSTRIPFDDRLVARESIRQVIGNFSRPAAVEIRKEQYT